MDEYQDSVEDFFTGIETPGLVNWAEMPTYNTIMALAGGVGLLMLALFLRDLVKARPGSATTLSTDSYAMGFGVVGLIQFVTGVHMTLTWPLAKGGFPFDNIIFGETTLAFGTMLLFAALYLWRRGEVIAASDAPLVTMSRGMRPTSLFAGGMGLALFGITLAGFVYQFYAAPPQEPLSGFFAPWPLLEAAALSLLFFIVGVGAVLLPIAVYRTTEEAPRAAEGIWNAIIWLWIIAGVMFALFGAMNFYTHIGFIVNTL